MINLIHLIYPQQKVLPFEFPGESIDTITEEKPDLGPLHLHLCKGLQFTAKHQMLIVNPVSIDAPDSLSAFYRVRNSNMTVINNTVAHFYTADKNSENVWNRPYYYINVFRKFRAIISTDFSILANMLEIQRLWNDFRNKLLAAFYQRFNVTVVASPSWSCDMSNIDRYMEGWPHSSVISINSTGVCQDKRSRHIWLDGYYAMIDILTPVHILRYGGYIEGEDKDISTYYINNNRQ